MNPWDQQPNETDKQYQGFCAYLLLGSGRSILSAWEQVRGVGSGASRGREKAPTFFGEWATANNWVERVSLYDQHVMKKAIDEDMETAKAILIKARSASLRCIEKIEKNVENESDTRTLSSALNALTQAISRLTPKGEVTLGEALEKVAQEVKAGNLEVLQAIFASLESGKSNGVEEARQ